MVYGHRNDAPGYAGALSYFDSKLPEMLRLLGEDDILMITADHGCYPVRPSPDNSREYVPLVIYGKNVPGGKNFGTRSTFSDVAATVLRQFGIASDIKGTAIF